MKNFLVAIGVVVILGLGYLAYLQRSVVVVAPSPSVATYTGDGYTIQYPRGWSADSNPGGGVTFVIGPHIADGTNLGSDTSLSVEQLPTGTACVDATSTDAGAGNRYEERVYAVKGTNPCIAVRYFIHYGVLENYPPGAVKSFDRAGLLAQFDAIRHTLVVGH
jgi:hypothetical protein